MKAPVGVGKPIFVNFYAPINEEAVNSLDELNLINYDPNEKPINLLQREKYDKFAYNECLRIGAHLQKYRAIELLRMKAEFVRDQYNNVWLVHCSDIQVRKCSATTFLQKLQHEEEQEQKMRLLNEQNKKNLEQEM